ncbi:hypothetical protein ABIE51_002459 [Lysobacter sp. OAE881]|uniref:CHC2 zinc finger domain-containing protein n=1 Tax=Lysobacter sp. OAE881 TaxID=2663813 RepID=UPI00178B62E7
MTAHRVPYRDASRGRGRTSLPRDWRDLLPAPAIYYARHVTKLGRPNAAGWSHGVCPFHDDHDPSLSVNVVACHGGWRCWAQCGSGDLVGFHMKRTGLSFTDAVRDLLGVRA